MGTPIDYIYENKLQWQPSFNGALEVPGRFGYRGALVVTPGKFISPEKQMPPKVMLKHAIAITDDAAMLMLAAELERRSAEMVREVQADGRTIFFSSHILPEVQAVCDRVGIIREGRLIKTEKVETLTKRRFKRLQLTLRQLPPRDAFAMEGVTETGRDGPTVTLEIWQGLDQVLERAVAYGIQDIETPPVTLEEIFLAFYNRQDRGGNHA